MEENNKKLEDKFKKGVEYLEADNLKDAIDAFEEVVKQNDKDAAAHFNLGLACTRMARSDIVKDELYEDRMDEEAWILRAISEFNKVLEYEPDNKEAKENIEVLKKLQAMGI